MKLKRIISTLVVSTIAVAALSTTAFAHCGGHHGCHTNRYRVSYPTCNYEDCTLGYNHYHGDVIYCGHYANDGHAHCACY